MSPPDEDAPLPGLEVSVLPSAPVSAEDPLATEEFADDDFGDSEWGDDFALNVPTTYEHTNSNGTQSSKDVDVTFDGIDKKGQELQVSHRGFSRTQ